MDTADATNREQAAGTKRRARLLTYVLGYDDLLREATTRFALDRAGDTVLLGRAAAGGPRNPVLEGGEVRVPDGWMSRRHAALVRRADGSWLLRDEASANGTFVNGVRLEAPRPLVDGDLIEVGHSLFVYREADTRDIEALERADAAPPLGPTRTHSPELAALAGALGRVARARESVLILGETGAGKEMIAEAVHRLSGRAGAYIAVDCGAVPESLFESTFFGHRRGAFTGAVEARTGEIARADGGTLFLDEVANMSLASQAKLLRVLEDGRFTPLGAASPQRADVRWVAAANRDLFDEPAAFRPDLLRRLAGFVARVPPLRRRREDLGVLTAHLLRDAGATRAAISAEAARWLFAGAFPGNVRELRAALRSALLLAGGETLELAHFDRAVEPREPRESPSAAAPNPARAEPAAAAGPPSREAIEAALRETGGNVMQAARALGTYPKQVYRWARSLGIDVERFRA